MYVEFFPVGPSSVTITRSLPSGDVELGATVTFTCSSTGGIPMPTIKLLVASTEMGSGAGPTFSQLVTTEMSMHDQLVKCEAFNAYGNVENTEPLALFSKAELFFFSCCCTRTA